MKIFSQKKDVVDETILRSEHPTVDQRDALIRKIAGEKYLSLVGMEVRSGCKAK